MATIYSAMTVKVEAVSSDMWLVTCPEISNWHEMVVARSEYIATCRALRMAFKERIDRLDGQIEFALQNSEP